MQISKRKFVRLIFAIVVFTIFVVVYNRYRQLKIQNFVYYGLLILTTVICIVKVLLLT